MPLSKNNERFNKLLQKQSEEDLTLSKKMLDYDIEQTIIEDKKIYDKCNLEDAGIEFYSKEFILWKEGNKTLFFPALDAPWQVRKSWSELEERVSKSEGKMKNSFKNLENQMYSNITKLNGLFFGIRLKSLNDYSNLINLAISTYNEFYSRTTNSIYKEYVNLLST